MFLVIYFGVACAKLQAAEITPKQSEALFQEMMKYPQFKAADGELSAAYAQVRATIDSNRQLQLRDEQRKWLKLRDQTIMSANPATRLDVAVQFTLVRAKQLGKAIGSERAAESATINQESHLIGEGKMLKSSNGALSPSVGATSNLGQGNIKVSRLSDKQERVLLIAGDPTTLIELRQFLNARFPDCGCMIAAEGLQPESLLPNEPSYTAREGCYMQKPGSPLQATRPGQVIIVPKITQLLREFQPTIIVISPSIRWFTNMEKVSNNDPDKQRKCIQSVRDTVERFSDAVKKSSNNAEILWAVPPFISEKIEHQGKAPTLFSLLAAMREAALKNGSEITDVVAIREAQFKEQALSSWLFEIKKKVIGIISNKNSQFENLGLESLNSLAGISAECARLKTVFDKEFEKENSKSTSLERIFLNRYRSQVYRDLQISLDANQTPLDSEIGIFKLRLALPRFSKDSKEDNKAKDVLDGRFHEDKSVFDYCNNNLRSIFSDAKNQPDVVEGIRVEISKLKERGIEDNPRVIKQLKNSLEVWNARSNEGTVALQLLHNEIKHLSNAINDEGRNCEAIKVLGSSLSGAPYALSSAKHLLLTSDGCALSIWDTKTGMLLRKRNVPVREIFGVGFLDNDREIAVIGRTGTSRYPSVGLYYYKFDSDVIEEGNFVPREYGNPHDTPVRYFLLNEGIIVGCCEFNSQWSGKRLSEITVFNSRFGKLSRFTIQDWSVLGSYNGGMLVRKIQEEDVRVVQVENLLKNIDPFGSRGPSADYSYNQYIFLNVLNRSNWSVEKLFEGSRVLDFPEGTFNSIGTANSEVFERDKFAAHDDLCFVDTKKGSFILDVRLPESPVILKNTNLESPEIKEGVSRKIEDSFDRIKNIIRGADAGALSSNEGPLSDLKLKCDKEIGRVYFQSENEDVTPQSSLRQRSSLCINRSKLGTFEDLDVFWGQNLKYMVGVITRPVSTGVSFDVCLIDYSGEIIDCISNVELSAGLSVDGLKMVHSRDGVYFSLSGALCKGVSQAGLGFKIFTNSKGVDKLVQLPHYHNAIDADVKLDFSPIVLSKCDKDLVSSHIETGEILSIYRFQGGDYDSKENVFRNIDRKRRFFDAVDGSRFKVEENGVISKVGISDISSKGAIFACSDNYYLAQKSASSKIHFVKGLNPFPLEQFDLRLNRPDIVLERLGAPDEAVTIARQLRQKRLIRMGVTEEMLQPDFHLPELEIVGTIPSSTNFDDLKINIKASDSKYPLSRLRVYLNNVPLKGRDGELLSEMAYLLDQTIPLHLAAGRNKIQVSVLNSAGAESLYANAEVNCTSRRSKPVFWLVSMGVSEYVNSDWNLKYAAKDAMDVASRIRARAGSNYSEVKELNLTDREVTKESLLKIRAFLSTASVDDTVMMFVAGHGLLDEKYDYYFGTTDVDFSNPSGRGIAFEEFDDILAELPCLKKSLLIDTCHAGELDDDEIKALASAQVNPAFVGTTQQVSMHQVGSRGALVKPTQGARGRSEWYDCLQGLFVDLRRGSGSTILSSSGGAEYALETSEQKNGLFTYAVLEALDGKKEADLNKDGDVQMSELADYVKLRVAELSKNKQTPNVRRVNLEGDFTLVKTSR